ncbi:hypothetical protein ADUPG1_007834 [Aduncisulcus paluster]|uniref:Uncharacterized protein n=1 Tax=Aduncisulcus paluster TaxID=2918883 RepID=A0ABQ5KPT5_9EUKA|nr:hypothetical protein ADUPG1_007834 [Aduncisulcus paluster]
MDKDIWEEIERKHLQEVILLKKQATEAQARVEELQDTIENDNHISRLQIMHEYEQIRKKRSDLEQKESDMLSDIRKEKVHIKHEKERLLTEKDELVRYKMQIRERVSEEFEMWKRSERQRLFDFEAQIRKRAIQVEIDEERVSKLKSEHEKQIAVAKQQSTESFQLMRELAQWKWEASLYSGEVKRLKDYIISLENEVRKEKETSISLTAKLQSNSEQLVELRESVTEGKQREKSLKLELEREKDRLSRLDRIRERERDRWSSRSYPYPLVGSLVGDGTKTSKKRTHGRHRKRKGHKSYQRGKADTDGDSSLMIGSKKVRWAEKGPSGNGFEGEEEESGSEYSYYDTESEEIAVKGSSRTSQKDNVVGSKKSKKMTESISKQAAEMSTPSPGDGTSSKSKKQSKQSLRGQDKQTSNGIPTKGTSKRPITPIRPISSGFKPQPSSPTLSLGTSFGSDDNEPIYDVHADQLEASMVQPPRTPFSGISPNTHGDPSLTTFDFTEEMDDDTQHTAYKTKDHESPSLAKSYIKAKPSPSPSESIFPSTFTDE